MQQLLTFETLVTLGYVSNPHHQKKVESARNRYSDVDQAR